MKKIIIAIMCVFGITTVYAENTNISTSQYYVDTNAATRQDAVPVHNTNTVMTYDSTSPDGIGAKAIYDTTASYADQTGALITADTANAAIQNGINSEFTCANPPKCNLWDIVQVGETSKNLFRGPYIGHLSTSISYVQSSYNLISSPFTPSGWYTGPVFVAKVTPGETYYISGETDAKHRFCAFYANEADITDKTKVISYYGCSNGGYIVPQGAHVMLMSFTNPNTNQITWSNVQLELGTSPTAYHPYGENTFVPQNVQ